VSISTKLTDLCALGNEDELVRVLGKKVKGQGNDSRIHVWSKEHCGNFDSHAFKRCGQKLPFLAKVYRSTDCFRGRSSLYFEQNPGFPTAQ